MSAFRLLLLHPADGDWRAYLDGEVEPARRDALLAHLARCARCRSRLIMIEADSRFAARTLRALEVAAASVDAPLPPELVLPRRKEEKVVKRSIRPLVAVAVALVMLLVPLAVSPSLRAAAADLFRGFRVGEKVTVIPVSEDDFEKMSRMPSDLFIRLEDEIFPSGQEQYAAMGEALGTTIEELTRQGFTPPTHIPDGYEPARLHSYTPAWEVTKQVNVANVNALLEEAGVAFRLPEASPTLELRYAEATSFQFTMVGPGEKERARVRQSGPRVWSAPQGVDLNALMPAVMVRSLEEKGASPELIEQMRDNYNVEDMAMPTPLGRGEAVKIHGAPGVFVGGPDGLENLLAWTKGGVLWEIMGHLSKDEMVKIAESMER